MGGQIYELMENYYKKANDVLDAENSELIREANEMQHDYMRLYGMLDEAHEETRLLRRQLENANEWSEQNWARTQTLLDAIEGFMASVDGHTRSMMYDEISRACRRHGTDFHGLLEDPEETEDELEQRVFIFSDEDE